MRRSRPCRACAAWTDLAFAASRVVAGGFTLAGQSCISVQRIFVHEAVADEFSRRLVEAVDKLEMGNPLDQSTDVGPMIDEGEAARVDSWIKEAVDASGRVLTGGRRLDRSMYAPTVLTDVPADAKVCAQEAFAPLVVLTRFNSFREGPRYTIEEMTEPRLLVINRQPA